MNSAPWWFVLVTSIVTGTFTLLGVGITAHVNAKAKDKELSAQAAIEREKRLYDKRSEHYGELLKIVDDLVDSAKNWNAEKKNPYPPGWPLVDFFNSRNIFDDQVQNVRNLWWCGRILHSRATDDAVLGFLKAVDFDAKEASDEVVKALILARSALVGAIRSEIGANMPGESED